MNKGRVGLLHFGLFGLPVLLAIVAADVLYPADPASRVIVTLAIALGFVAAGLVAWARRPTNGLGPLMTILGFCLLVRKFQYGKPDSWLFTVGFLVRDLPWVVFGHIVVSYPTGRLTRRRERIFAVVAYTAAMALPLAALLVHERLPGAEEAAESAIAIWPDADVYDVLRQVESFVIYGALPVLLVGLIAAKLVEASPRARRMYTPLLVFGLILALRGIIEAIYSFSEPSQDEEEVLFWTGQAMEVALGIALVVSVFRVIQARATLADALADLHGASPEGVRAALADVLGDPELDVAFWMPERKVYVNAAGAPYDFPVHDPGRAITAIRGTEGKPLAALVHDVGLENEPALVRDAAAAAGLALENARLHAELRAQLVLVQESRARIVAAGDEEPRRLERDLHDCAQQQLVALALQLRATQRRLGGDMPDEVHEVLSSTVGELQRAVEQLRELAHGVHPSVLTQSGLAAALQALAAQTPTVVTVAQAPTERLPPPIEAAAYFVACEALTNAVKRRRDANHDLRVSA